MSEWLSASEALALVLRRELNPHIAEKKLLDVVRSGGVPARIEMLRADGASECVFFPQDWGSRAVVVNFQDGSGESSLWNDYTKSPCAIETFSNLTMSKRHLLELWPGEIGAPVTPKPASRQGVGGAPTKYSWAEAAGYMTHYVVENDYPATKADAVRVLQAWFQKRHQEPDKRDVEKFVDQLWPTARA